MIDWTPAQRRLLAHASRRNDVPTILGLFVEAGVMTVERREDGRRVWTATDDYADQVYADLGSTTIVEPGPNGEDD